MANLKNITDLPVAESAEGLNLIVNDNGAAKQIAAGAIALQNVNPLMVEIITSTPGFYGSTENSINKSFEEIKQALLAGQPTQVWVKNSQFNGSRYYHYSSGYITPVFPIYVPEYDMIACVNPNSGRADYFIRSDNSVEEYLD